jgi:hypothetical protein
MPRLARVAFQFCLIVCAAAAPARAQDPAPADPPAHISVVDGSAVLERDGRSESAPTSMPLLAGDRVRTQGGRVEILFADGSTLHLDANTLVDFQSDEVVRLLNGRVRLNIAGTQRSVAYRVDAPSAWVQIATPGEYRVTVSNDNEIELAVLRGEAELVNEDGGTSLGAGERAFARLGARPSSAYVFNSAAWDAFDTWSEARRSARLGVTAEYLPETVQPYASTFAEYGTWRNEPTYGYVWYPRVAPTWRPYFYGSWTTLRPWGWTWIGSDPWAWPTHHYGRWGFSAGAWFWIPGRVWGPAWVSWAYAPGYVSWCPLGWNNRAVFAFNFHGGRHYDPWRAWTVVPHRGFGRGRVNINVVNVTRIDVRTRNAFVVRDAAPDFRGHAVPRSSAPIRTAVSRNSTFGGSNAFRGSRVDSRALSPRDSDAAAAFRNRATPSPRLNGPGYPPAARTPSRAVPSVERGSPQNTAPSRQNGVRTRESGAPAPSEPGPMQRRAVPRSAPEYRAAPDYRAAPAPPQADPSIRSTPDGGYNRAVPRGGRRETDVYEPSRTYGVQQDRRSSQPERYRAPEYRAPEYRAPERSAPRAMPRSEPNTAPAPSPYRSPSIERSRPSGMDRPAAAPPPSRAPERAAPSRAPERSAPSQGGGSRSRGGGESSGRAVSRSRGR